MSFSLIDHHCHGVTQGVLDADGVEALLTEAPGPPPAGTSRFDSQLGFAVRRWCAPVLDLEPSAPAASYLERRAELGPAEVNRRMLRAAQVEAWLVDTGYLAGRMLSPAQLAAASGAPGYEIVRLEAVAERVARSGCGAGGFAAAFADELARAAANAVGLKSIVAYRYGLDFDPAPPGAAEVEAAAARWLRAAEAAASGAGTADDGAGTADDGAGTADDGAGTADDGAGTAARLDDPALLRHLIWAAMDTGLPVQFHVGFGDPDLRLRRADPSWMHDFLIATRSRGTPVMLLHCYPYHRQAAYLASVFPHVYMDVGLALNHVGARAAAVLAETLELAPFTKVLYSSDALGLAELHYLGALGFRRDLARVTGDFVADGAWSAGDAARVMDLIGAANARRVYRLADR